MAHLRTCSWPSRFALGAFVQVTHGKHEGRFGVVKESAGRNMLLVRFADLKGGTETLTEQELEAIPSLQPLITREQKLSAKYLANGWPSPGEAGYERPIVGNFCEVTYGENEGRCGEIVSDRRSLARHEVRFADLDPVTIPFEAAVLRKVTREQVEAKFQADKMASLAEREAKGLAAVTRDSYVEVLFGEHAGRCGRITHDRRDGDKPFSIDFADVKGGSGAFTDGAVRKLAGEEIEMMATMTTKMVAEKAAAAIQEIENAAQKVGACAAAARKMYTEAEGIWDALMTGAVRLVRASWIIEQSKAGRILARRQDLGEEAFLKVEELKDIYSKSGQASSPHKLLPIIAISFCWLTYAHPDPEGKHLATVAAALEREMPKYAAVGHQADRFFSGFHEMGVFWDWISLYQKDPALFDPRETPDAKLETERAAFLGDLKAERKFFGGEAYEKSRTETEKRVFKFALKTMDLWYAHTTTIVYLLTKLPEGTTTRLFGYNDSGWTTFERCSAEQAKKSAVNFELLLDLGLPEGEAVPRRWPTGPDDFDSIVDTKNFTNDADVMAVKEIYRKMSANQLGGVEMLAYDGMPAPSVEDARRLGSCLNYCINLYQLRMNGIGLNDESLQALLSALSDGALPKLKMMSLRHNSISNAGVRALAAAVTSGALPACNFIDLLDE